MNEKNILKLSYFLSEQIDAFDDMHQFKGECEESANFDISVERDISTRPSQTWTLGDRIGNPFWR